MALTRTNTMKTEEATVEAAAETLTAEGVSATAQQAEPEVEAQAAQVEADKPEASAPAEAPQQAVAARPTAAAPAVSNGPGIEQDMADMGFEGLTIGGMSFDRVKLPSEGVFLYGSDEIDLGKEFNAIIQGSKAIYIIRQSDDEDAENYYSYQPDGLVDTNGNDRADTLAEWREEGYEKPVVRRYLEVMVQMFDQDENGIPGERDGAIAMLSIPPASIQRISGYLFQLTKMKGLMPSEVVTTFVVGNKVKKGNNSFFPWNAKMHSQI